MSGRAPMGGAMESIALEIVREFMATMDAAKEAANRSVLDGTVSCRVCRALLLESNEDGHYAWHAKNGARP